MACEVWQEKLEAYIDGELPVPEASAFSAHLRQCSTCAAETLERVQMKRSVAAAAGNAYPARTEFRRKMLQRVSKPARRGQWWPRLVTLSAALILLISMANFYLSREKARQELVVSELTDLHVAALASSTPVDVVSTDRHTVKPWFEGRIPFSFNLPELSGTELSLVGGRVAYLGQTPGAHLIYRVRKHEISVFIFPDRGGITANLPSPVTKLSFTVASWAKDGLRYFVIGDVSASDVDGLSKLLRNAS